MSRSLEASIIEAVIEEDEAEARLLLERMARRERLEFVGVLEVVIELALARNRHLAEQGEWHR